MVAILPPAKTVFVDQNGAPLSGGSVTFYVPGTTTLQTTWADSLGTVINSNPVILDSSGSATIWGSGSYRQVVQDSLGNIIWDQITEYTAPITTGLDTDFFVDNHGAVGNGTTDDTLAIQATLTAASAAGGGVVRLGPKSYLINSPLTIPPHVSLFGNFWCGGQQDNNNYTGMPFTLYLGAAATIAPSSQSALVGVALVSSRYTKPGSIRDAINLVNGYTGTAITNTGNDTFVENVFAVGFAQLYYSSGFQRLHVRNVIGDNKAGIIIDNCHDTGRVSDVHFWNYATANQSWTVTTIPVAGITNNSGVFHVATTAAHGLLAGDVITINGVVGTGYGTTGPTQPNQRWTVTNPTTQAFDLLASTFAGTYTSGGTITVIAGWARPGPAFSCTNSESVVFTNCQAFGYNIGGSCGVSAGWVKWIGCAWDNYAPAMDNQTIGFQFISSCYACYLVGCHIVEYGTPILAQSTSPYANNLTACQIASNGAGSNWDLEMVSGALDVVGCEFDPGPNNASINVYDAITSLTISGSRVVVGSINYQTPMGTGQQNTVIDGKGYGGLVVTSANYDVTADIPAEWRKGIGAPTHNATTGSMFSREDGGVGARLYVSAGGGTWAAVAGV